MRVITQHTVGDPSVLDLVEADCPEPGYGQVLIRTGAIGVNPVDGQVRSGELAMLGEPPFTVGWDIAGTVEAAGPGVSAFAPGDGCWACSPFRGRATPTPSASWPRSTRSSTSPPVSPSSRRPVCRWPV
ncbi:alcohol dehydrogenase catalytic domain-containing protein [Streptomyces sp. NPDC059455]|uniref:alcohol dehydrogenase catalytic domain-containing protein n=1 Tax=Streptomyces sp. NPDC059455 TaxID=3346837 RepID=UPI0036C30D5B